MSEASHPEGTGPQDSPRARPHAATRDVIASVNQLEASGVISTYAIGGAVGAAFYLEPVSTLDVDIFVLFQSTPGSLLIDPRPLFDHLRGLGFPMKGEYVMMSGWPVQFLPPNGPLVEEALEQAVQRDVAGVAARVFRPEHLAAVALQTGRAKDKARLLQFVEAGVLDMAALDGILRRHGLSAAWQRFQNTFLNDSP